MQCWVALDRGLHIAWERGLPADWERLRNSSDAIYESIMQRGWNPERGAFMEYFGGSGLDASTLQLPMSGFVSPTDPRILSTLQRVREEFVSRAGRLNEARFIFETMVTYAYTSGFTRRKSGRQAKLWGISLRR